MTLLADRGRTLPTSFPRMSGTRERSSIGTYSVVGRLTECNDGITLEAFYVECEGVHVKRSIVVAMAALAFSVGLFISPAFAAGSHPGPFATVFGNSTSCALGRASTNDATERGGALTNNYWGCNSSNGARNVPANYLGARAFVAHATNGAVCGESATYWNTSTTWTRDASTSREYYNAYCFAPGYYFGLAVNFRKSDAGNIYVRNDRFANAYWFPSYLI